VVLPRHSNVIRPEGFSLGEVFGGKRGRGTSQIRTGWLKGQCGTREKKVDERGEIESPRVCIHGNRNCPAIEELAREPVINEREMNLDRAVDKPR
jgi:hypothetical protein